MSRRVAPRFAALLVAFVAAIGLVLTGCSGKGQAGIKVISPEQAADYDYVIPRGAIQAAKAGKSLDIVPQDLKVKVGERIRIRNKDAYGATVGVFYVGAGETVSMKFTKKGTLKGECQVHPSGQFTITVT